MKFCHYLRCRASNSSNFKWNFTKLMQTQSLTPNCLAQVPKWSISSCGFKSNCPVHQNMSFLTVRISQQLGHPCPLDAFLVTCQNFREGGSAHPSGFFVVVFVFNVPPTAKVILRQGHSFKSHPTDLLSRESSLRPLVYKASGFGHAWYVHWTTLN